MDKLSYALGLGIGHQLKSMNIENFNDIKIGDIIEAFHVVEIKRTL